MSEAAEKAPALNVAALSDEAARDALAQLAERLDADIHPRAHRRDWAKAESDGHASENSDGTIIVRLYKPLGHGDQAVSRVTIRRVRVRDMRAAEIDGKTDLHQLTASLSEPNVYDDLEIMEDAGLLMAASARQLGKFLGSSSSTAAPASAASSVSSGPTSASPRVI